MRLWHLTLIILIVAVILAIAREAVGRVFLVVFCTGLGEVVLGTMAVMSLFQTIGALGHADGLIAHAEAIAATAMVLVVGTSSMLGVLWIGLMVLKAVVT